MRYCGHRVTALIQTAVTIRTRICNTFQMLRHECRKNNDQSVFYDTPSHDRGYDTGVNYPDSFNSYRLYSLYISPNSCTFLPVMQLLLTTIEIPNGHNKAKVLMPYKKTISLGHVCYNPSFKRHNYATPIEFVPVSVVIKATKRDNHRL